MKRKFITVQNIQRKRKLYLDDLTQIHQIIKKTHPKIPKFTNLNKNPPQEEDHDFENDISI